MKHSHNVEFINPFYLVVFRCNEKRSYGFRLVELVPILRLSVAVIFIFLESPSLCGLEELADINSTALAS